MTTAVNSWEEGVCRGRVPETIDGAKENRSFSTGTHTQELAEWMEGSMADKKPDIGPRGLSDNQLPWQIMGMSFHPLSSPC